MLAEREEVYVRSARVVGASDRRILLRHIFPNIAPPLIVQVTLTVGAVLLAEAGLSFIGLGVQPPQASWGTMLNTAAAFMELNWFLAIPPGIAIILTVLSVNLLGDVLRDSIGRGIAVAAPPRRPPARFEAGCTTPAATAAPPPGGRTRSCGSKACRSSSRRRPAATADHHRPVASTSPGARRWAWSAKSGSGKTMTGLRSSA